MSRSDNTPWRPDWLESEQARHWQMWPLPRGAGRALRRHWNKKQRARERAALSRQLEPEPSYPRGTVKYDYW